MIKEGERLPDATFWVLEDNQPATRQTADVFAGRRVAVLGVPGAFSRVCSGNHLPGFLARVDDFKAKGVDEVVCIAVNDPFVLAAWARDSGAEGKVVFLGDGNADFARATGLDNDVTARGQGIRSKRYAMLVEDGVVTILNVEDTPAKAEASSADALLAKL